MSNIKFNKFTCQPGYAKEMSLQEFTNKHVKTIGHKKVKEAFEAAGGKLSTKAKKAPIPAKEEKAEDSEKK